MPKLRLSSAARADLAAIDDYSASRFGKAAADKYSRGLKSSLNLLRSHVFAGAACHELCVGMRSLIHRRHRVFYIVQNDTVVIVRVLHHAMDARKVLEDGS